MATRIPCAAHQQAAMHDQQPGANFLYADQHLRWKHMSEVRHRFSSGGGIAFNLYW